MAYSHGMLHIQGIENQFKLFSTGREKEKRKHVIHVKHATSIIQDMYQDYSMWCVMLCYVAHSLDKTKATTRLACLMHLSKSTVA